MEENKKNFNQINEKLKFVEKVEGLQEEIKVLNEKNSKLEKDIETIKVKLENKKAEYN